MTIFLRGLVVTLSLFASAGAAVEQQPAHSLEQFRSGMPPPSKLLILGTFHFKDAGLDSYKPSVDFDALDDERQREVADVVERLVAFKPGRIALEASGERATQLQEEYRRYLDDGFQLGANEIYQLGFRLAKRLGHERVYFVDAQGRRYAQGEPVASAAACSQDAEPDEWNERYFALYRHDDQAKATRPLRETLLYMNSEERLLAGHGHYLVDAFHLGCDEDYYGADAVTGWWYNRNLRIFANLGRIREPGERMLLIIGAGHVPIIRHAAKASPEFKVVEVRDVL